MNLAQTLLKSYFNLEIPETAPLWLQGISYYWQSYIDEKEPAFRLQRTLPIGMRRQIFRVLGIQDDIVNPLDVPKNIRGDRWNLLCESILSWELLSGEKRDRLLALLHALCFYELIIELTSEKTCDPRQIYWNASATYVYGLPERINDYIYADMTSFSELARSEETPHGTALFAALKVFVHNAKIGATVQELQTWRDIASHHLESHVTSLRSFQRDLYTSCFYRATAMLYQALNDREQVIRHMDLAEKYARRIKPESAAEKIIFFENLHPLVESRIKEAYWLGENHLALSRSEELINLDPYDAKCWLELGEARYRLNNFREAADAFLVASMLGPPAQAIGLFMAGLAYEKVNESTLAAFCFGKAIKEDPLSWSPHEGLNRLPKAPIYDLIRDWSAENVWL